MPKFAATVFIEIHWKCICCNLHLFGAEYLVIPKVEKL